MSDKLEEAQFKAEWRDALEAIRAFGFMRIDLRYDQGYAWHVAECWLDDRHVIEAVFEELDMPFCSLDEWVEKIKVGRDKFTANKLPV